MVRSQAAGAAEVGVETIRHDARRVPLARLRRRIDDMQDMAATLERLIGDCEHATGAPRCPVIASIESPPPSRRNRAPS